MTKSRNLALSLLITCTFASFGCTTQTTAKKEPELDANGKPIEYVWVTPTGSHIAVKVPKDQAGTTQNSTDKDQAVLRKLQSNNKNPGE